MKLRATARLRALIPALALAGCTGWQSAIDVHGASAISLKHLIVVIVATCSVVWALVIATLIVALWRRREARESAIALDPRRQRRMTLAVGGAVAATVIVISAFTVSSFFTTRQLTAAGADDVGTGQRRGVFRCGGDRRTASLPVEAMRGLPRNPWNGGERQNRSRSDACRGTEIYRCRPFGDHARLPRCMDR